MQEVFLVLSLIDQTIQGVYETVQMAQDAIIENYSLTEEEEVSLKANDECDSFRITCNEINTWEETTW